MSDISTLKEKINTKTFTLLLLGLLSGGLYINVWMYKTFTALEEVTHIKTMSPALFAFYLIIMGFIGTLGPVPHDDASVLIGVLFILYLLLTLLWCFRVRRVLKAYALAEHNFELRMNRQLVRLNLAPRLHERRGAALAHQQRAAVRVDQQGGGDVDMSGGLGGKRRHDQRPLTQKQQGSHVRRSRSKTKANSRTDFADAADPL